MLHLHLIINQQAASGAAKRKSKEIITLLNQKISNIRLIIQNFRVTPLPLLICWRTII